jgi:hypothetical protein
VATGHGLPTYAKVANKLPTFQCTNVQLRHQPNHQGQEPHQQTDGLWPKELQQMEKYHMWLAHVQGAHPLETEDFDERRWKLGDPTHVAKKQTAPEENL